MLIDTSMTLDDLTVRVAEAIGVQSFTNPDDATDNRARPPTDPNALDRCHRAINDAQQYMARKHRWKCLKPEYSITLYPDGDGPQNVNGDAGVYRLPRWLAGLPTQPMTVSVTDENGTTATGQGGFVQITSSDRIRSLRSASPDATGRPLYAVVVAATMPNADQDDIWGNLLHVYPNPSDSYILTGEFRVSPYRLKIGSDRHIFGGQHDLTLVTVSTYIALRDDRANESDPSVIANWKDDAEQAIAESWVLDGEMQPQSVGVMHDPANGWTGGELSGRQVPVYFNGVRVS